MSLCETPRGRELISFDSLSEVEPTARRMIEDSLSSREFIPVIQRVYDVSSLSEPCEWDVETDRGRNRFVLRNRS